MERKRFLEYVEKFLKDSGMSATAFSKKATGDPTYVATLRRGRESREAKQRRVLDFIESFSLTKNQSGE